MILRKPYYLLKSQDELVLDAENPLINSYERWRALVGSTALLLQAYLAPVFDSSISVQLGVTAGSNSGLQLVVSIIAYSVSAGLIFASYVNAMIWFYKKKLWHRFNKRFAIMGYWDTAFLYQSADDGEEKVQPSGYAIVEQDYLGRCEVTGFYEFDRDQGFYLSEFTMSGTLYMKGSRPAFRFFFQTQHFGRPDIKFAPIADISDGIENVAVSNVSKTTGYPTRLTGAFSIYKRSNDKSSWAGHSTYSRNDDHSISHELYIT